MILQLDPPIPVTTPKGKALAVVVRDYGIEHDDYWTCILNDTGEFWTFSNKQIKAQENKTLGRKR